MSYLWINKNPTGGNFASGAVWHTIVFKVTSGSITGGGGGISGFDIKGDGKRSGPTNGFLTVWSWCRLVRIIFAETNGYTSLRTDFNGYGFG